MQTGKQAIWLLAFGNLEDYTGPVVTRFPSGRLLDLLLTRKRWYLPRVPRGMAVRDLVVLYENEKGVQAVATVESVTSDIVIEPEVRNALRSMSFAVQIELSNIERFSAPVSLRPIVDHLEFISNKRFWGQSLRSTPRKISESDLDLILEQARSQATKSPLQQSGQGQCLDVPTWSGTCRG